VAKLTWFIAVAVLILDQETYQLVVSKKKVEKVKRKETLLYGERKSIYVLEISCDSPARPSDKNGMKLKMSMEMLEWWQIVAWNRAHGIFDFWLVQMGTIWRLNYL
jgi:hypothetical protein